MQTKNYLFQSTRRSINSIDKLFRLKNITQQIGMSQQHVPLEKYTMNHIYKWEIFVKSECNSLKLLRHTVELARL